MPPSSYCPNVFMPNIFPSKALVLKKWTTKLTASASPGILLDEQILTTPQMGKLRNWW